MKQVVYFRQKQGRGAHLERMGVGVPSSEECSKEVVQSFIYISASGSLSSFRPIIWFLFSTPDLDLP